MVLKEKKEELIVEEMLSVTMQAAIPKPTASIVLGLFTMPLERRRVTLSGARRPRCCFQRRSGNYQPTSWDFNYIQSLTSPYAGEKPATRAAGHILQVKKLLLLQQQMEEEAVIPLLELIDDLQRLGISHHFGQEINQILNGVYFNNDPPAGRDLYSTALAFRLLRDHGFPVSQDAFDCFKNEKGRFRQSLGDDTRGVLQLYEASFLLTDGEESLQMAKDFATDCLQRKVDEEGDDLAMVRHALELPIHWRIQWPNARCFIDAYGRQPRMNQTVFDLAKLNFNIVQAMHQHELNLISRWWKQTRLTEKMPFARDRLVECYLWALALFPPESEYGYSRMMITKANLLITIIDDIFDVYGTLEELHIFNTVIQSWDLEVMDQLPSYMQICFLALNNFINEMAYHVLNEQGILIIQHLRQSWKDLVRSFMQEAQWHATGYTPTLNEYISNGWISSTVPVILSHAFFLIENPVKKEAVRSLYDYHDLVRYPAIVLRLANDLATSTNEMERGDVAACIECYMKETGASREEAGEHVKFMIWKTWKKMNEEIRVGDCKFSQDFVRSAVDLGRMAQYVYQHGDGHGIQNSQIKKRISSLLFEPIILGTLLNISNMAD